MRSRRSNRFWALMEGKLVNIDTSRAPAEGDLVAVLGQGDELNKPVGYTLGMNEGDILGCIELVGAPIHDKVDE